MPDDLVARTTGGAATISRVDTAGLMRVTDRSTEVLYMSRDDQAQLVGPGWSEVDADEVGPLRWMVGEEASLLLPLSSRAPRRIQLQARGASAIDLPGMRLQLNGRDLGARLVEPRWRTFEWEVPDGVARVGTNTLALTVDENTAAGAVASTRQRVAVSEVRLLRELAPADRGAPPSASIRPCS
jgi:hypothetical protein